MLHIQHDCLTLLNHCFQLWFRVEFFSVINCKRSFLEMVPRKVSFWSWVAPTNNYAQLTFIKFLNKFDDDLYKPVTTTTKGSCWRIRETNDSFESLLTVRWWALMKSSAVISVGHLPFKMPFRIVSSEMIPFTKLRWKITHSTTASNWQFKSLITILNI